MQHDKHYDDPKELNVDQLNCLNDETDGEYKKNEKFNKHTYAMEI
jgi:hypothetical protein